MLLIECFKLQQQFTLVHKNHPINLYEALPIILQVFVLINFQF